jgi:signal transduction histidine kinase
MRLPDFILANVEPIVNEWQSVALAIWPGRSAEGLTLNGHAADILIAVANEMIAPTARPLAGGRKKGSGKSRQRMRGTASDLAEAVPDTQAVGSLTSGFQPNELVVEYRALRASVIQLWLDSTPEPDPDAMRDIMRMNEVIDQLLEESIAGFVRRMNASRECFLGIIGHDLRNPLSTANMIAHMLEKSTKTDSQFLRMASILRASVVAMDRLIRDLLDFTGTRLGARMTVASRPMDLLSLCREVIAGMQDANPSRRFILAPTAESELAGEWDEERLRQLITSLMANAIQHGFESSPITLTATSTDFGVHLEVHNFGPSIPEEMLGVIFDPISRRHGRGTGLPVGSVGLGLYIAWEVANAHGGSITVASAREETVFSVKLPRHHSEVPARGLECRATKRSKTKACVGLSAVSPQPPPTWSRGPRTPRPSPPATSPATA